VEIALDNNLPPPSAVPKVLSARSRWVRLARKLFLEKEDAAVNEPTREALVPENRTSVRELHLRRAKKVRSKLSGLV